MNIDTLRNDFPILVQTMHGKPLVYLDNANTTQKPKSVIQITDSYYREENSNIHRSVYALSERATQHFESTRTRIQAFINAQYLHEIIFTKGTTESINLIAESLSHFHFKAEDEIIISAMEHHSNIVPWQFVCERIGAHLKIIPISNEGELDLAVYEQLFNARTKLVSISHVSNVLGTLNPVKKIIEIAHAQGVPVLLDGAQGAPHLSVDVQTLDCDFYVFSSHKLYGPTGVGVLYGKQKWLDRMPPYQGGGHMIRQVTFSKTTYNELPYKFEAGTSNIAGVIGLGEAIEYVQKLSMKEIGQHEHELLRVATQQLAEIPEVRIIGTAPEKAAVISFVMEGIHPHDVGTALDTYGVAVRVGHHCAMPLMERFGVPATIRVSFGLYNTLEEVEVLIQSLWEVKKLFGSF